MQIYGLNSQKPQEHEFTVWEHPKTVNTLKGGFDAPKPFQCLANDLETCMNDLRTPKHGMRGVNMSLRLGNIPKS